MNLNSRVLDIIDGYKWGSVVNSTTNSFDGMIGMVQRQVKFITYYNYIFFSKVPKAGGTYGSWRNYCNKGSAYSSRIQLPIFLHPYWILYQETFTFVKSFCNILAIRRNYLAHPGWDLACFLHDLLVCL